MFRVPFLDSVFSCVVILAMIAFSAIASAQSPSMEWKAGAAKADVTPKQSVRLSGYGSRTTSTQIVDDPLFVRALALQHSDKPVQVIVSIDAIGLSASLTDKLTTKLQEQHQLRREQIVLCTTHSHTAPQLDDVLTNLYSTPLVEAEAENMHEYTRELLAVVHEVVAQAIGNMQPSDVRFEIGQAGFAVNRRVVQDRSWKEFGTTEGGPVDRAVRVIRVNRPDGSTLAVAYQYACHCTSIDPQLNRISADWAGLSAGLIESALQGSSNQPVVALPIIGCGADANPNPRGSYENAQLHANEMSRAVQDVCSKEMQELPAPKVNSFQLVALASERPSREKLEEMLNRSSFVERNFAQSMLNILQHKDRLPETYPAPVHLWTFGDQLAWVFLGGEVVVDYQIRLERELSHFKQVWVAAYTDDVFAYVASERVRGEGGYEVDGSMLYYNQPGRWVSGTEDVLVSRILTMAADRRSADMPMTPQESLAAIQVPPGWKVELIASEPLITDPVNVSFGANGSVWVVEMGDYPSGGSKSGCIKRLLDTDKDGVLDSATVFLDQLSFPTGAYPWRDGLVVSCAPDVFFVRDTDGDGVGDERRVLLTGFPLANPQHRVNGFTYGLDHRLHLSVGAGAEEIEEVATGRKINVADHDISLDVDSGRVYLETGSTQFIRACDDWGNWFGNDNSHPIFHYVWHPDWPEPNNPVLGKYQHLMQPPSAPPVFPATRDADRFNDLFAANRFTSACSSVICRSSGVPGYMEGCGLVCESVHNLVSRIQIYRVGSSFRGKRFDEDENSEWLRSSDPWFRPVRVENGIDGSIWIVDMYRRVIEHPEWIPEEWQRRLDVRAGDDMGRIYRVYRSGSSRFETKDWTKVSLLKLVEGLQSPSSAVADIAMQQMIWRAQGNPAEAGAIIEELKNLSRVGDQIAARPRAYAALIALQRCSIEDWQAVCNDPDDRVVRFGVEAITKYAKPNGGLRHILVKVARSRMASEHADIAFQLIRGLCQQSPVESEVIGDLFAMHPNDPWLAQATVFLPEGSIDRVLDRLLANQDPRVAPLINSMILLASPEKKKSLRDHVLHTRSERPLWHYLLGQDFLNQSDAPDADATRLERLQRDARKACLDKRRDTSLRIAALNVWTAKVEQLTDDEIDKLISLLPGCEYVELEQAILQRVAAIGTVAWEKCFGRWNEMSDFIRAKIIAKCISSDSTAGLVLEQISDGLVTAQDFQPSHIELLRQNNSETVRALVAKHFGAPASGDRQAIVQDYIRQWPSSTDSARGEVLFQKHCAQCHLDRVVEDQILPAAGPNLLALSGWRNELWVNGILDPNQAVEPKYRRFIALTEDGESIHGVKVRERLAYVELMTDQGELVRLDRAEIAEMRESNLSLMPEGFEKMLSAQEIADIISYLRQSKR